MQITYISYQRPHRPPTKGTGGTGLGLSVSYGIIQAHGGTITAESTLDVGTTFIIRLPRCPEGVDICADGIGSTS